MPDITEHREIRERDRAAIAGARRGDPQADAPKWSHRFAWFALLYLAGLAAVGVVAWLLRAWLG